MRYLLKNTAIVNNNGMRDNIQVLVEGKKILKVSREAINIPAMEYDLSGYTLMPGFINTHVHLMECFDGFNDDKLKKWLMAGITYLRDQGILSRYTVKDAVKWRDKYKNSCMHPGIAVCGKFISAKKWLWWCGTTWCYYRK
jgi:imidazolonepropionase-like amidohydrolase